MMAASATLCRRAAGTNSRAVIHPATPPSHRTRAAFDTSGLTTISAVVPVASSVQATIL